MKLKFYNFTYDNKVNNYQYIPYLDGIDKELIDQYNQFILKYNYGFYQDKTNPNNYNQDKKRYINDEDIKEIYNELYISNNELYKKLTEQFYKQMSIHQTNYNMYSLYRNYLYKIQKSLSNDNNRIYNNLDKFNKNKFYKNYFNINYTIITIIIIFIIYMFIKLLNY